MYMSYRVNRRSNNSIRYNGYTILNVVLHAILLVYHALQYIKMYVRFRAYFVLMNDDGVRHYGTVDIV